MRLRPGTEESGFVAETEQRNLAQETLWLFNVDDQKENEVLAVAIMVPGVAQSLLQVQREVLVELEAARYQVSKAYLR